MVLVLALMAGIWFGGAVLGVERRWRGLALLGLWLAVLAEQLLLPVGHMLREMTGGGPQIWVIFGWGAGLVLAYRAGLVWLRARAAGPGVPVAPGGAERASEGAAVGASRPGAFGPEELERYSRHILLREIGGPGQKRLKAGRVLVVGAGGLGSPALLYLAAAGVGTIGVVDDDVVDASNLQRQVIHRTAAIGQGKVASAAAAMRALNPFVTVQEHPVRLTAENAAELLGGYDLVLDGSDNFDTRYLVNALAARAGKPLISAAITQWEGQISLYDPARGAPCYACAFPQRPAPGMVPTCAEAGVAAPLPGIIGAMMAMEAVKHVTGAGTGLQGRLLMYDALEGEARVIRFGRAPDCPVCGLGASVA